MTGWVEIAVFAVKDSISFRNILYQRALRDLVPNPVFVLSLLLVVSGNDSLKKFDQCVSGCVRAEAGRTGIWHCIPFLQ